MSRWDDQIPVTPGEHQFAHQAAQWEDRGQFQAPSSQYSTQQEVQPYQGVVQDFHQPQMHGQGFRDENLTQNQDHGPRFPTQQHGPNSSMPSQQQGYSSGFHQQRPHFPAQQQAYSPSIPNRRHDHSPSMSSQQQGYSSSSHQQNPSQSSSHTSQTSHRRIYHHREPAQYLIRPLFSPPSPEGSYYAPSPSPHGAPINHGEVQQHQRFYSEGQQQNLGRALRQERFPHLVFPDQDAGEPSRQASDNWAPAHTDSAPPRLHLRPIADAYPPSPHGFDGRVPPPKPQPPPLPPRPRPQRSQEDNLRLAQAMADILEPVEPGSWECATLDAQAVTKPPPPLPSSATQIRFVTERDDSREKEKEKIDLASRRQPIDASSIPGHALPHPNSQPGQITVLGFPVPDDEPEPMPELPAQEYNILLVGEAGIGLTSLILTQANGHWVDAAEKWSLSRLKRLVEKKIAYETEMAIDTRRIKVTLWDVPLDKVDTIHPSNTTGWDAVIICSDASLPCTLLNPLRWWAANKDTIKAATHHPLPIHVVALKRDLLVPSRHRLSKQHGEFMAASFAATNYSEVSAKESDGVNGLFGDMLRRVYDQRLAGWEADIETHRIQAHRARTYRTLWGEEPPAVL